ncbi:RHS repeat domain-containing protein [Caldimonas brevitalea]|nr:RHS repeat domain-containing protein [Caldimonas brevitalea]
MTYTYDTLGRVKTVTYSNGVVITYTYDAAGNRTSVVTAGAS